MKFPYESERFGTLNLVEGLNKPEKSEVYLVSSVESGIRYVLRKMYGEPTVYDQVAEIRDPHIPEVFEICQGTGCYYVLEEYISGENLADVITNSALSAKKVQSIMAGLCDALSVLHGHGIVHRDIKPENVILRGETPVLLDYDAARIHKAASSGDTEVLGTTGFAAPEQYGIYQTDERTDIYAMGVLLNILMTGKHPTVTLAPGGAGRIVQKCTMMNPNQRFQSAEQLKVRLHTIARPDTRKIAVAAAAVVAVLAILVVALWPKREEIPVVQEEPEETAQVQQNEVPVEANTLLEGYTNATERSAEELGVAVDDLLGYYLEIPQMGDARIQNFSFIITEERPTLYYVFPDQVGAFECIKVQCFTGDSTSYVEPTSPELLGHTTFGTVIPTEIPGYSCVPITFDMDFSGMGNLHMCAYYNTSNSIGGNIYVFSLDEAQIGLADWEGQLEFQATGNGKLNAAQDDGSNGTVVEAQQEGQMGYYDQFPTAESEPLPGRLELSEENRTLWLMYSEKWFGEEFESLEIYEGDGSDGPPEPTSPNVLEHITLGEPVQSNVEGCVCVPITVDEGYQGTGNLHINLNYGHELVVGGNIYLIQE